MQGSIAPTRLAALLGDFDRAPAYAGLTDALRGLICDGRLGVDLRLPSERDLSVALGLSRTTVTRAYAGLAESGFARARQGSGTYTRLPGGRQRGLDRTLTPSSTDDDVIDLNAAAPAALPGVGAVYADALQDLPRYLGGHGYFPTGVPALQEAVAASYDARGLPTDPAQIMVVPGALSALTIVAQALVGARDRVLVESPGYPNAFAALRRAGARLVAAPMDVDGWDLDTIGRVLTTTRPALAYLIPDFQNPTANLMPNARREELAALLRRTGTVAVVDESHQALALDGRAMPRPFAAFAPDTVTLGSTSKSFWGGLRVGWVRCPDGVLDRLMAARVALDLGSPVLEQLVAARLLHRRDELWDVRRAGLREQRDALADALRTQLPAWRFRLPRGGLTIWCELPAGERRGGAVDLVTEGEGRGVVVSPGPVFAVDGGLDSFVRVPYSRPPDELRLAVDRLAEAWAVVREQGSPPAARPETRRTRVMVA
ncbi:PLP-dependent aminotransferase family protein [Nocardioides cynanchi]|uniref:MocR-like transcription factor YczR n=1 Tax=Nocardioides cynanchi TaxID=2558918 RepID=UPI00124559F8|nr:PLP-dependent aminotransferase family protein [Nocardioides cynanchi]